MSSPYYPLDIAFFTERSNISFTTANLRIWFFRSACLRIALTIEDISRFLVLSPKAISKKNSLTIAKQSRVWTLLTFERGNNWVWNLHWIKTNRTRRARVYSRRYFLDNFSNLAISEIHKERDWHRNERAKLKVDQKSWASSRMRRNYYIRHFDAFCVLVELV